MRFRRRKVDAHKRRRDLWTTDGRPIEADIYSPHFDPNVYAKWSTEKAKEIRNQVLDDNPTIIELGMIVAEYEMQRDGEDDRWDDEDDRWDDEDES